MVDDGEALFLSVPIGLAVGTLNLKHSPFVDSRENLVFPVNDNEGVALEKSIVAPAE